MARTWLVLVAPQVAELHHTGHGSALPTLLSDGQPQLLPRGAKLRHLVWLQVQVPDDRYVEALRARLTKAGHAAMKHLVPGEVCRPIGTAGGLQNTHWRTVRPGVSKRRGREGCRAFSCEGKGLGLRTGTEVLLVEHEHAVSFEEGCVETLHKQNQKKLKEGLARSRK